MPVAKTFGSLEHKLVYPRVLRKGIRLNSGAEPAAVIAINGFAFFTTVLLVWEGREAGESQKT